ncbi:class I SAM-dependent methyltransferase [Enterovirga sp.]|uniref:class I SAM-dependent methyltransferase n=1 Tax=Enterovirga sp. TaxID=2026350 RepID=UPI00262E859A|nr:class I SAM-dependent methyltransferase [Enterovirga sp.]MDB5592821.1 methyltransferase [Enterovirga sp.]
MKQQSLAKACILSVLLMGSAAAQTAAPTPPTAGTPSATGTPPAASPPSTFTPTSGQSGKDVVWVPTQQALVDGMLDMAGAKPGDYVIDLGSGDGRTVITAAKRGIRALGVEYNADMVTLSRRAAEAEGVSKLAQFVEGDIFKTDFSEATVLTLFLLPNLNQRLRPDILKMKPGTRVVSNTFDMGDWTADNTFSTPGSCTSFCRAYLWIVPANAAGTWRLPEGELTLTQTYQTLAGTLNQSGKEVPVSDAKMKGAEITFTAGGRQYTGLVEGDRMRGKVDGQDFIAARSGG